jgi:hypothetical protein
MSNQAKCQYPGCPQEVIENSGWCRGHKVWENGKLPTSNQDSQDELRDKLFKKTANGWYYLVDADDVPQASVHYEAIEKMMDIINAHTQRLVTEARIDELQGTKQNIIDNNTVMGVVGSINSRIATLTNQREEK